MLINCDSKVIRYAPKTTYGLIDSDIREPRSIFEQTINTNNISVTENIGVLEDVISREMCQYIINCGESVKNWSKAVTVGESDGAYKAENSPRQNDILMISGMPELEAIDKFINKIYSKTIAEYIYKASGLSVLQAGITRDEGYQMLRYHKNGFYKSHTDYSSVVGKSGSDTIRVISGLIYLTDDHEGGEIYFPHHDIKIKPKAGSVVFFPSIFTHPHTSCTIVEGTKYNIVTWWK